MRPKVNERVRLAAARAASQHGNVTAAQLLEPAWSRPMVKRWHAKGLLHREFRGVYRFGHRAPGWAPRAMAAVLACGDGALLGGFASAFLFGADPAPAAHAGGGGAPGAARSRVTIRRRRLRGTVWRGIPTTTLPQTIADLAPQLGSTSSPRSATAREPAIVSIRLRCCASLAAPQEWAGSV